MDTGTVMIIIAELDKLAKDAQREADKDLDESYTAYCKGQANAFTAYRDHLQGFIEAKVNALENQGSE
jgi:hypothetical protein